jgi:hypothetical protein
VEQRLVEMERRLVRAERRAYGTTVVAVVVGVVALILVGARPAATETTETMVKAPFRVVADEGKTRFYVDATTKDITRVQIYNSQGKVAASLASILDSGSLALMSGANKPGALMTSFEKQGGALTLYDGAGTESFSKP